MDISQSEKNQAISMPSIIIVEDHPAVQEGLVSYFERTGKWRITGTASNLDQAKELLTKNTADILLLDIQLENELGLNLIPWLKQKEKSSHAEPCKIPIIAVYTAYDDYVHVSAALGKGVQVYMCKRRSLIELEKALENALNSENYIDKSIQTKLEIITGIKETLTRREKEIFSLVKNGIANKQIAEQLGVNIRTVENFLSRIYKKHGVKSRQDLQAL